MLDAGAYPRQGHARSKSGRHAAAAPMTAPTSRSRQGQAHPQQQADEDQSAAVGEAPGELSTKAPKEIPEQNARPKRVPSQSFIHRYSHVPPAWHSLP